MDIQSKELLADVVTIEEYPDEPAWLAARRTGLGASDFGAVLGLARKSPLQLWSEKVGLFGLDDEETEQMFWGKRLEPQIRQRYTEITQREVFYPGPHILIRSREFPWLCASLDGITMRDGRPGPLEAKTAAFWKREEWQEEPPLLYQIQVLIQQIVTTWTWGSIAVLLGGQKFLYADLERNQPLIEELLLAGEQFWRLVQDRTPPLPDASESAKEILKLLYPKPEPGKVVVLPKEAEQWDEQLGDAKTAEKDAKERKRAAENWFRSQLGDAERGVMQNGVTYTLKLIEKQIPLKETYTQSYRELRRRENP